MGTKTVKVIRSFYYGNKVLKVGETAVLPAILAIECQASRKCEIIPDAEPAKPEPAETKPEGKPKTDPKAGWDPKSKGK